MTQWRDSHILSFGKAYFIYLESINLIELGLCVNLGKDVVDFALIGKKYNTQFDRDKIKVIPVEYPKPPSKWDYTPKEGDWFYIKHKDSDDAWNGLYCLRDDKVRGYNGEYLLNSLLSYYKFAKSDFIFNPPKEI